MSGDAAARLLLYPPATFLVGCLGLLWLDRGAGDEALQRRVAVWGLVASLLLLFSVCARALVQAWSVFGNELTIESFQRVALESRWGKRWLWQLRAVPIILAGYLLMRRAPRPGSALAGLGLLALFAALPLTGHAASDAPLRAAQSLHAAGGALWVGTLILVLLLGGAQRTKLLLRFAPVATVSVAGMLLGAAVLSWHTLPDLQSLWTSPWGRWWSVKVSAVAVMLALGARNWRRLRRARATNDVPSSAAAEAILGTFVLLITAFLTSTGQPGME
ncbi:MAG: CopD family protein [Acidobacteriota bacterium]